MTSQTAAISPTFVSNVIISPPNGQPVFFAWDFAAFYVADLNKYATTHGCASPSAAIMAAWSGDYASSSPSNIVALCTWQGTNKSGFSIDGGKTFTAFSSFPPGGNDGGCIASTTPNNIVSVQVGITPYLTVNQGTSWSALSFSGITGASGWPVAFFNDDQPCAADRVNGVFYLYNANGLSGGADSIWTVNSSGVTTQQCTKCDGTQNFDNGADNVFTVELKAMPGVAGELLFSNTGGNQPLKISTNSGVSWANITNITDVWTFGFGAIKSGSSFPSIWFYGTFSGTFGLWRSNDNAVTWTQACANQSSCQTSDQYPLGYISQFKTLTGDSTNYGFVYMCAGGNACVYGYFP